MEKWETSQIHKQMNIYTHTHIGVPQTPKTFGSTQGGDLNDQSPKNLPAVDASSIDFSLQFLKVGFLPRQKMHRWICRWSRAASGKCCIYIWLFCKQLRYIIDKQKIHHLEKSNNFAWYHPTKEHIYKTHWCTLSGNPIWYAPHAPTLIATTTSLTFLRWCGSVWCYQHISLLQQQSRFAIHRALKVHWLQLVIGDLIKLFISSTTAFLRGEFQSSNGGK